ncbi:dihydrolipoyl dehydrogenase family protein [Propionicimonas sp.]|uniref:dihydrolipoyl dehydrogenase family protein n=1 Tax=Propionicimonas sp. TaxID=1955623 RepID=UPI0039E2FB7F
MATQSFDVVVIGAGPAGENVADYAIRGSGRTALLVERELVGGECSYYACMPSKALLRPLDVQAAAEHLPGLPHRLELDVPALLARRDSWVSGYNDKGQADWARGAGIEVARGTGRITGERRVLIEDANGAREVIARHAVVVATGSRPVVPRLFADLHPWTSRDATGILDVPDSIAVIGGGVVAVEACVWLAALGASVTLLVRGPRVLSRFEPFASELVAAGLGRRGVEVRLDARVDSAARLDGADTGLGRVHGGPVLIEVEGRGQEFSEVLVATGRTPATSDIGLETIGLTGDGFADPAGRPDWLYAVGDASGEAPLTHWGKYRARLMGERIAARAEGRPDPDVPAEVPVPQVVFTDPQVASVGLTEADAVARGAATRCAQVPLTSAAGFSLLRDDASGQAKLVFEAGSERLLGATFAGQEVAELVHAATIAIVCRLTATQLWHAVPSYPTASEVWLRLLEDYRAR